MSSTFIVDLEGVLIQRVNQPVLHPEAQELLTRAHNDFDETYLWTLAGVLESYSILRAYHLTPYFNKMIGRYGPREHGREVMIGIGNGKWNATSHFLPKSKFHKDLSLLGDPRNMVLLEDEATLTQKEVDLVSGIFRIDPKAFPENMRVMKNGFPVERVVHIHSFTADYTPSLLDAY